MRQQTLVKLRTVIELHGNALLRRDCWADKMVRAVGVFSETSDCQHAKNICNATRTISLSQTFLHVTPRVM